MRTDDLRRGALLMVTSGMLFAAMSAMIKLVSTQLPNEMVVFFRAAIGLLALAPWLVPRGRHGLKTRHPGAHLLRGLAGLAAMYCYFYAIVHMPLAEATLLNYSTPLFVPFLAWLALGEGIARRLWTAIAVGFFGILLILKPGMGLFTPVALVGMASGVFAALAMVSIRRLTRSEPALRIVFYFSLVCTLGSAVPLLWSWQTPAPGLWVVLIAIGALASIAQFLLTRAYAHAPAAEVGPFTYSTVVFAALVGWFFWGEMPDALSFLGAVLVCVAGVLTIRYGGRRTAPVAEMPDGRSV
jgi:drug/metabolite transporter (DMT)-like permease